MMKKTVIVMMLITILVFVFSTISSAQLAEIKVGKGTLKMGGILQAGYDYSLAEDSISVNGQFTLNRARFLFWGEIVPGKVKYFVQTETKGGLGVLDYKMIFVNVLPNTDICVGRFLPNFSLYMPSATSKLDMINYPLLVSNYAMWRQAGVQSTTKLNNLCFNVGIFNGPVNNTKDNNDAKDVLLRAGFKPDLGFGKVCVGGYAWLGNFLFAEDESYNKDLAYNRFGFFGKLKMNELTAKVEMVMGSDEDAYYNVSKNELETRKSLGYYAHVGYKITPEIELMGRYDFMDSNTDGDVKKDSQNWITLGANYCIEKHNAMIYLNYIIKSEEDNWGYDDEIKNDMLQLQFQVAF